MRYSNLRVIALFALATMTMFGFAARPAVAADQPNILFIFSDDHATASIGAYKEWLHEYAPTPNLDKLASQGMLFDRAYVTNSICGPMRAVILTGKYSHLNGFFRNGNRFDGSQQTFPKLMQKAGYQTAIVGKWHLESDPTGFDYWHILPGQGAYYNPPMIDNGKRVQHEGYTTEIITDVALDWLKNKRDKSKPFIMMAQHKAPHRNWAPGPNELDMYKDVKLPEPDTLFDDYSNRATPAKTQDMSIERTMNPSDLKLNEPRGLNPEQLARWKATYDKENEAFQKADLTGKDLVRWKYQRYIKDYLRCVAAVDKSVGELLAYLDESGLADNTIVIYSSDQGFYLGEHGWFDKRWMYEESLRTPLIVRWPGVTKPGTRDSKTIVSPLDFPETFLDAAGVPIPGDMQGRSLRPVLAGNVPSDWRTTFYYHYYEFPGAHSVRKHYGVTDGRYKLIHYYEPEVNEWELFDLQKDPKELRSVYGTEDYADVQKRMQLELNRLRQVYKLPAEDPPASLSPRRNDKDKKKGGPKKKAA